MYFKGEGSFYLFFLREFSTCFFFFKLCINMEVLGGGGVKFFRFFVHYEYDLEMDFENCGGHVGPHFLRGNSKKSYRVVNSIVQFSYFFQIF